MNQHNWMRYGCYDGARGDSNKLEILFGQNVGGKANNGFGLALLLWWLIKCWADYGEAG